MFLKHQLTPKDVNQGQLEKILRKLFPNENIQTNARRESLIINPATGSLFELDIWIPNLSICFEFQDEYHYINKWYSQDSIAAIKLKDIVKKQEIARQGISLVLVPYWWDGTSESIKETIKFERPDLLDISLKFNESSLPISINPPPHSPGSIPDVGDLMLATFPSNNFVTSVSPIDSYWTGEKYDGIRACWNPHQGILYTRSGLAITLPDSFSSRFPSICLDSEMWLGRGRFNDVLSLYKSSSEDMEWDLLRVVVFDVPTSQHDYKMLPFEKRYTRIINSLSPTHPFITIAPRALCSSRKFLTKLMDHVIKDGGEGVIMRKPNSPYVHGRSNLLWKIKEGPQDTEALVFQIKEDRSLATLQLPNGTLFDIQLKDEDIKQGDVVTFSYESWQPQSTTDAQSATTDTQSEVPINPVLVRVREDMSWEEVVLNFNIENSPKGSTKPTTRPNELEDPSLSTLSKYHYSDVKNRRIFFDKFAEANGFDPLIAENWYKINTVSFSDVKGATSVLNYYSTSVMRALLHVYPDIGLKENQFNSRPVGYWQSYQNRRKFCEDFAHSQGFDPLVPDNWYSVFRTTFISKGMAGGLVDHYGGSYVRAIVNSFPDIKFDISKFGDQVGKRRKWFLDFAKRHSFDPLSPENWYSKKDELLTEKQAMKPILYHYKGSIKLALLNLFPNIGLQSRKLKH